METAIITALVGALAGGLVGYVGFVLRKRLEGKTANTAILVEIQRLITVAKEHKEWWDACVEAGDTDYPLIPFSTPVYDHQVKNIGAIDRAHVVQVVKFYGYLGFLNSLQEKRPSYAKGTEADFARQYQRVLERFIHDYEHSFDSAYTRYNLAREDVRMII